MLYRVGLLCVMLIAASCVCRAFAQTPSPTASPAPAVTTPAVSADSAAPAAPAASLTEAQMSQAIAIDTLTIPTPGELFAALSKPGKPDWASQYRGPIPTTYNNRAQIALNLGGLIADGFIAVESQDGQQVKNTGADIIKLAKALGVSENVLGRGKSVNEFAENDEWAALHEELEATQNEVKTSMQSNQDQDYIILVSLGGWIRGTQVITGLLKQDYSEVGAKTLRQPALVAFIRKKVDAISPALRDEPLVQHVRSQLDEIEKMVTFPKTGTPTPEEVRKLHETVTNLMGEIQKKTDAE